MQLRNLFSDDDAVSPVIGVILMVAITVILAAVIASFVLGLGQQATDGQPTASFTFDYSENSAIPDASAADGNLTIAHDTGDSIPATELYLRGDFDGASGDNSVVNATTWDVYNSTHMVNVSEKSISGEDNQVVSGDRLTVGIGSAYEIRVVWESPEGQSSATLQSDSGPDA